MVDLADELYMKCKVCCRELSQWASPERVEACSVKCVAQWEPIPFGEWGYLTRPCDRWKI